MIPAAEVVSLSRLQFALTAMYHFLFVPLTLGLSVLLAIMETVYVMTGREIWRRMTKFWGVLFGINFAMGVATGITMEFQFGTNWAYYSHYVGDVFGVPLAIEGLMAFFLEATFVGIFFFGWGRMSKFSHMVTTWLLAIGTNLSALWILVANGWMQHPTGAKFNFETMRMEVSSFAEVLFNPVAQAKFVHTISAGYVTGAIFVLSISAYYLLRKRHTDLARRSMAVAASFGLASALSVAVLGDESGYAANHNQHMKVAAMEAMWETEAAPADLTVIGWPDEEAKQTKFAVKMPWVLGLIATRSIDKEVPGIHQLVDQAKGRIRNGMKAYGALEKLQRNPKNAAAKKVFARYQDDLGYGLLLKRYTEKVTNATTAQINQAANDTVPHVLPLFFSFRAMVGIGLLMIALFATAFYLVARRRLLQSRRFLHIAFWALPLPWLASELGWFVAEYGRQPWVIEGMLPTFLATSSVSSGSVMTSLIGFIVLYSGLAVVELYLMIRTIRRGPTTA